MKIKRILCVVVSAFMYINTFFVYSSAAEREIDVYEYNKLIRKLTDAYVPDNFVSTEEIAEYPLNRLIVKTTSNEPLENDYGASDKIEGYNCLHILQYETEEETDEAYKNLINDDIEYVEYDYWLTITDSLKSCYCEESVSSIYLCSCTGYAFCPCEDPDAKGDHYSWSSSAVQVDEAFRLIDEHGISCEPIKVAVLDTGVYAAHEEFSKNGDVENRIKTDPDYVYIKNYVSYPSDEDDYYHGTHVAGIVHNNTMDNVVIYSYRMSGKTLSALSCSELTAAINAAVAEDVDVINMSLRREEFFKDSDNRLLEESLKYAVANNVVIVAGAGNDSDNADNFIPSKFDEVITVSATTRNNVPDKSYSSYGECVDIGAPGTDIRSTSPRNEKDDEIVESPKMMMRISGTSMATPLVSAAAAIIKSIDPDITPAEVKRIIKETAYVPDDWEESCDGKNYGTGIVNFYNIAKTMLDPEYSVTPTVKLNDDNKIEITAPEGTDARIYYSIGTKTSEATVPTIDNHLLYSEPIDIEKFIKENKGNDAIKEVIAVCHENGKLIGKPAEFQVFSQKSDTINYKKTVRILAKSKALGAKWSVQNPDIVSIDGEGNITGVGVGETRVTVKYPSGEKEYYNITVKYAWWQEIIRIFFLGFLWY